MSPLFYRLLLALSISVLTGAFIPPTTIQAQDSTPQQQAIEWLIGQQREDGGWSDTLGPVSGAGITADAVLALWANGVDLESLPVSPLDFLENYTSRNALDLPTHLLPKLILAAVAGGRDLRDFGGVDLLAVVGQPQAGDWWGGDSYQHGYWLLAMAVADQPRPITALNHLRQAQNDDGSWSWGGATEGDPFSTALALLAFNAWGEPNPAAEAWLLARITTAGVGLGEKMAPDAYTTASTLLALRDHPQAAPTLQTALLTYQTEAGGFLYQPGGLDTMAILMTPQALLALAPTSLLALGD